MKWWDVQVVIAKIILAITKWAVYLGIAMIARYYYLQGEMTAVVFFVTLLILPILIWAFMVVTYAD